MHARGSGAPETTEAFARARKSASATRTRRAVGGRLRPVGRQLRARRAVGDEGARGGLPRRRRGEARFAGGRRRSSRRRDHHWFAGEYREARAHLERALALFQPGATTTIWPFASGGRRRRGDALSSRSRCGRWARSNARDFARWRPLRRGSRASPMSARARYGKCHVALFELMRGDLARATPNALELAGSRASMSCRLWRRVRRVSRGRGETDDGAPAAGSRTCAAAPNFCASRTSWCSTELLKIALAEAEARAGDVDRALAILDEALATSERIGYRAFEAELHRVRGEMLLKRDPAEPRACGGSLPNRHRGREAASYAQLRTARSAVAGQALSIDRPSRRRPRRPRARARRLFADAGNAGDRRGAGAAGGAGGDGRGQSGGRAAASTSNCTWLMATR